MRNINDIVASGISAQGLLAGVVSHILYISQNIITQKLRLIQVLRLATKYVSLKRILLSNRAKVHDAYYQATALKCAVMSHIYATPRKSAL